MPPRLLGLLAVLFLTPAAHAADWPTWRFDAQRTGASPQELPAKLHLHWTRDYPPARPAWPEQEKMQFDAAAEPVVANRTLYLNSSRHDCVRALDTRTGAEKWIFFADGPVRFAPAVWQGNVYFTSDDGHLYCLDAEAGTLRWKFRGGPDGRKILGNERLISVWPARGAPVVADDTVYFAASIWPFMGVFIHALDARTGTPRWINDGDGSAYMKQPHNTDAFAGVAPQGPLAVNGDKLLLPGGRSIPACLDRATGKLLRYQLAENGKRGGGSDVATLGNLFVNGGTAFDLATQKYLGELGKQVVLTPDVIFAHAGGKLRAYDVHSAGVREDEGDEIKSTLKRTKRWRMDELAALSVPAAETLVKAGSRLYLGGDDSILAVDFDGKELRLGWQADVDGKVVRLIAADDRLFAVTLEGRVYCFAGDPATPRVHAWVSEPAKEDRDAERRANDVLKAAPIREGYAIVWGLGDGQLLRALVRQTKLHFVVVEPDADKVRQAREQLTRDDLYGTRVALVPGMPSAVRLPPYLASLMVCEDPALLDEAFLTKSFQSLRPFGGTACFFAPADRRNLFARVQANLPGSKLDVRDGLILLARVGPLPGSANWTHEHADAANTRVSRDQLVKAPLGLLWFGGPSHEGILPRHGHGPQPQVSDGRLLIEGVDLLRAIDIYTGRLLWETRLPGVGALYNNLAHQPGANATGGNYVCTPDCIYVVLGTECVRLDPATGKKLGAFRLPPSPGKREPPRWGYLNVAGDYLIGGADPLFDPKMLPAVPKGKDNGDDDEPAGKKPPKSSLSKLLKKLKGFSDNYSSSRRLVVMDRHTGNVLWSVAARNGFRHNGTCVGGGRLYTIDRLSGDQLAQYRRKDEEPPHPFRLLALDLKTGEKVWSTQTDVFGTWLSYSEQHDVLVESGRVARDTLFDEPKGMRAYRAKDGNVLWYEKSYVGPAMLHGDTVLQNQGACDLLTGAIKMRDDPLTGLPTPWRWQRTYGCNTPAASEHLLTFRSGAAGYYDLCHDGGTGNFGGFRSSCTNNLLVAGGVLTAPEYTRTCTCAYQNQTSLALVHQPDVETWTFFGSKDVPGPVRRVGLNLGAPGDRRADDGTLWLEYPSVAGASPAVTVTTLPAKLELFRRHSAFVAGAYAWVAGSGAKDVRELSVELNNEEDETRLYTVRLIFAEPDDVAPGQRLFDVAVQGQTALRDFDVAKEAGGRLRSVVKEFAGVRAGEQLTIRLTPSERAAVGSTLLSGVEIIAEEKRE